MTGMANRDMSDDEPLASALEGRLDAALQVDRARIDRVRAATLATFSSEAHARLARTQRSHLRRWGMAAALGATLLAGAGVVAAASGPGAPFYGVRLALGSLLLPADPVARERDLAGELEDRLQEVRSTSQRGDVTGLQAALEAYRSTLTQVTEGGIVDESVLQRLERHRDVLETLVTTVPDAAKDGLRQTLRVTQEAAASTPNAVPSAEPHASPPDNPRPSSLPTHRP